MKGRPLQPDAYAAHMSDQVPELDELAEIESRIVGIDDIAGYVEQRFVRDGEICARGVIKARFLKKSGGIVPIPELAELFGLDPDNHPLPDWLAEWSSSVTLPPRREATPSVWE